MTRTARAASLLAGLALGLAARAHAGGAPQVVYKDGLLSIQCADAPLAGVLDQVKAATGMELIYEGAPASMRLTAAIAAQPASLVLPRLLEGTGVNYLLVADRADPRRVATMYVGDAKSGTSPGSPAVAPRPPGRPPKASPAPFVEPEPMPIPEAPVNAEPADDDDKPTTPEPEVVAPAAPQTPEGFHPIADPFGRPIPANNRGGGGGRRLGRAGEAGRQQ
jgi:hypothetical protein